MYIPVYTPWLHDPTRLPGTQESADIQFWNVPTTTRFGFNSLFELQRHEATYPCGWVGVLLHRVLCI